MASFLKNYFEIKILKWYFFVSFYSWSTDFLNHWETDWSVFLGWNENWDVACRTDSSLIELQSLKRNDISREFKDIIGENISSHLDKLKSEVHLIEDDIKQAVTEMSKLVTILKCRWPIWKITAGHQHSQIAIFMIILSPTPWNCHHHQVTHIIRWIYFKHQLNTWLWKTKWTKSKKLEWTSLTMMKKVLYVLYAGHFD